MHTTQEVDSVAGKLARWIQDRELSNNVAPAFINLAKNAASLHICLSESAQTDYEGILPNHAYADAVQEGAEVLAEESDLLVLLQYESAGIVEKGDMESILLYAARILNRTAELVAEWRRVEQEVSPEETGRFPCLMVG